MGLKFQNDIGEICVILREKIRRLELAPGTRLVEQKLADTLSTSRANIRQSLLVLSHEGIVSHVVNKGAVVSSPPLSEAREIFTTRRVIERACVREAAIRIRPGEVDELQAMIELEKQAIAEGKISDALNHSSGFHAGISRIAKNGTMHKILQEILGRSSLVCSLYSKKNRSPCHFEDHQKILDSLARHDIAEAMAEMERHLTNLEGSLNLEDCSGLDLSSEQ